MSPGRQGDARSHDRSNISHWRRRRAGSHGEIRLSERRPSAKASRELPDLLSGDGNDATSPRRWLLIGREVGVPREEAGSSFWALDHLFLDQDGVPTLVEVKRGGDARIRREVVGQMLDYAANGVAYWPVGRLQSLFEATCEARGEDPETVLTSFANGSEEEFWKTVKTNLQAGRIRLVFVADAIPPELQRVVEFLNTQMDPAEVLAVELPRYAARGLQTLVPRVLGQTQEARSRKAGGSDRSLKRISTGAG